VSSLARPGRGGEWRGAACVALVDGHTVCVRDAAPRRRVHDKCPPVVYDRRRIEREHSLDCHIHYTWRAYVDGLQHDQGSSSLAVGLGVDRGLGEQDGLLSGVIDPAETNFNDFLRTNLEI
jgi:hypothetical protein